MTDINVAIGTDEINVTVAGGVANNYIAADTNFYLDGADGDTYFKYNSTSNKLEVWVSGTKQTEFGAVEGGNPF